MGPPTRFKSLPVVVVCAALAALVRAHPAAAQECDQAAAHPEWIFCHDFEAPDAADFEKYWDDVYGAPDRMFLVDDSPAGLAGTRSMRLRIVNDTNTAFESGVTAGPKKFLGREVDWEVLHYRRYMRFNADFHQGNFMHLGGLAACAPSLYPWSCLGHAGQRPSGDEMFSSNLEPWSDYQRLPWPGRWGFYSYYYRMYKDCGLPGPDDCYGDMFAPEDDVLATRGDWHVFEMAVDPGTPGESDGSQTFWLDGRKAFTADGIAWRTSSSVRLNEAGVYLYIHNNPAHTTNVLDVDNVVFSRGYIGPATCVLDTAIAAPCLCGGAPDPEDASHVVATGYCCEGEWSRVPCGSGSPTPTAPPPGATPTPRAEPTARLFLPWSAG